MPKPALIMPNRLMCSAMIDLIKGMWNCIVAAFKYNVNIYITFYIFTLHLQCDEVVW